MYVKIKKEKVYFCYSWKLKDELVRNGFDYIGKDVNKKTDKMYWTFYKTDELCKVLKNWSGNKN